MAKLAAVVLLLLASHRLLARRSRSFSRFAEAESVPNFLNPRPEAKDVVLVSAEMLRDAEKLIIGCEGCAPENADLPFDNILHRVTGSDQSVTDYVMVECMAKCPQCRRPVNEKTLVEIQAAGGWFKKPIS